MEEGRWESAAATFDSLANSDRDAKIAETSKRLLEKSRLGARLPKKSPALAAIMSSLVPGSGQIYCGHVFDGLQAMAFVGAFALATFQAYRYDRDVADSDAILYLSSSVSGFFYLANVMGAHHTAQFRNHKTKQNFMEEVRNIAFEVTEESNQKSFEEEEK
jgi:TM2 domain-containing membrane protein YozV